MAGCRRLSEHEVLRILGGSYELFSLSVAERLVTQFTLMLNTGIRINECCHLRVGDISRGGEVARLMTLQRRFVKGRRMGRNIVLNDFSRHELERWLNYSGLKSAASTAWLFPPTKGSYSDRNDNYWWDRPVNAKSVRKALAHLTAALMITGPVSCHSFRKTFGWNVYLKSGRDILVAMKALGHTDPMHTMAYLDIASEDVAAAINRIYSAV